MARYYAAITVGVCALGAGMFITEHSYWLAAVCSLGVLLSAWAVIKGSPPP